MPVGQGWTDLGVAEHALVLAAAAQVFPHLVHDTALPVLATALPNHAESTTCCGSAIFRYGVPTNFVIFFRNNWTIVFLGLKIVMYLVRVIIKISVMHCHR